MFLMPLYQAVPDPVSLIQIAIVSKAVAAKEGFVGLFNQQVITGGLTIDCEPDEIGAAGGEARSPMEIVSERFGEQPAVTRFEDEVDGGHAVPGLILAEMHFPTAAALRNAH